MAETTEVRETLVKGYLEPLTSILDIAVNLRVNLCGKFGKLWGICAVAADSH